MVKKALKKISKTLEKAADAGSASKAAKALTNRGYIDAIGVWTNEAANCEIAKGP